MTERILEPLTLRPEQEAAVKRMAEEFTSAAIQASELGTGKTLMAVELTRRLGAQTILIVGPLHTRYGWEKTFARQGVTLDFRFVNGKKDGKLALADLKAGVPGIYFAGREWFRLQKWVGYSVDFFCWDECHAIANRTSAGYKALRPLKRGYTLLQSDTWFGGQFDGAWSVTRSAWPDLIDSSFYRWRDRWCATEFDPFTYDKKRITGEKNPGEYVESLPCYIRLEANGSEPVFEEARIDLTPAERRAYRGMEEDSVAWLKDNPLIPNLPPERYIRLRQLGMGEASVRQVERVYTDKETGEKKKRLADQVYYETGFKSSTLDTLKQILADLGDKKVLITSDHATFIRAAAPVIGAFAWIGEASQEEREAAKKEFIEGDLKYIFAHPAAISEGTDGLQLSSHVLIRVSKSDNSVLNRQLIGRLNRFGQTKQVVVVDLIRNGTEDDAQAATALRKQEAINKSVVLRNQKIA